jgi:hypothetical protein
MELHDSKHIRGELVVLLNEQLDTLERETFGGATETELSEIRGQARSHL